MSDKTFYLHVESGLAALPLSVTAVWYPTPPPYISRYDTQENIRQIDELCDNNQLVFEHDWVYPQTVNRLGYRRACRLAIEQIIPRLSLKTKIHPEEVKVPFLSPASFHYPCISQHPEKVSEFNIAKLIGWTLRKEETRDIWHPHLPQYGWNINNGRLDRTHALACIEHGVNLRHHYIEELKRVPMTWIKEIKKKNPHYLLGRNYAKSPPDWWCTLYNTKDFFAFMSNEGRYNAIALVRQRCVNPLVKYYPPLPLNA